MNQNWNLQKHVLGGGWGGRSRGNGNWKLKPSMGVVSGPCQAQIQGRWNGWIFTPLLFLSPLLSFFSYPYIEIIFDFSDIITKIHPPFQNPGSAPACSRSVWVPQVITNFCRWVCRFVIGCWVPRIPWLGTFGSLLFFLYCSLQGMETTSVACATSAHYMYL